MIQPYKRNTFPTQILIFDEVSFFKYSIIECQYLGSLENINTKSRHQNQGKNVPICTEGKGNNPGYDDYLLITNKVPCVYPSNVMQVNINKSQGLQIDTLS